MSTASAISKIAFVSLGCPKNLVDSEQMLGTLTDAGLELVADHDQADAIIINTCGFLESAKEESLEVIGEAIGRKDAGHVQRVIVAGCLVQRHRAKLLDWAPGIDAMIGVFDRDHVLDAVQGSTSRARQEADPGSGGLRAESTAGSTPPYWIAGNALTAAEQRGMNTTGLTVHGKDGKGIGYFEDDSHRLRLTPRHWAYLRMSEGCNQKCTFCTIPSIRGKMRSKPPEVISREARALMADGAFELNLIGQDTTSYGYDIGYEKGLVGLLRSLNDVAATSGGGGGWLRLMYAYPTHFTDAMIDTIAELPNVVKYIDIPLQHATDHMLGRMRRNVTAEHQHNLLTRLRERIPGVAIRTTFITGFPGETDDDHVALLDFIEEIQFDMMGVFQYSREAGTPAATMEDDPDLRVPDELKAHREAELMLLQQEIAFENAKYVAEQRCEFDVLIDGEEPVASDAESTPFRGRGRGRCYHQAPEVDSVTYVTSDTRLVPGELVRCTIVDADGYDLIARPTDELDRRTSLPVIS